MLVLADGPGGGAFLDNQHTTTTYQHVYDELRPLALIPDESARWLRRPGPAGKPGARGERGRAG
jgi:hypothetical protein